MSSLRSFLRTQSFGDVENSRLSKLAEQKLTPAEVTRLADNLVAEWQIDPELRERSLAMIGKRPKDSITQRDLEMMVRLLHATHSKDAGVLGEYAKHTSKIHTLVEKTAGSRLRMLARVEREFVPGATNWNLFVGSKPAGYIQTSNGQVSSTKLKPEFRNLGLGKKFYGEVTRRMPNQTLKSDSVVSPDAARVWDRLDKSKGWEVAQAPWSKRTPEGGVRSPSPRHQNAHAGLSADVASQMDAAAAQSGTARPWSYRGTLPEKSAIKLPWDDPPLLPYLTKKGNIAAMAGHAATGAVVGGSMGAYGAKDGNRMRGAILGGAAGAALGAPTRKMVTALEATSPVVAGHIAAHRTPIEYGTAAASGSKGGLVVGLGERIFGKEVEKKAATPDYGSYSGERFHPQHVHNAANAVGMKWDNNPVFKRQCREWVGKEHLDTMTPAELSTVVGHVLRTTSLMAKHLTPAQIAKVTQQDPELHALCEMELGELAVHGSLTKAKAHQLFGLTEAREKLKKAQNGKLLLKEAGVVEEYAKHTALNLGQAARDIRYLTNHPGAPEGAGHAFESVKRRLPSLLNNLFYAAVPPHLHHDKAELAAMGGSLGDWYRRGYAPWKHAAPAAKIADAPSDSTEKQAKVALAGIEYHGKTFPGYNQPIASDKKEKKMMVLAKKGEEVRLIHFGQKGYQHNYSPEAKQNYLTRSAGIRDKSGQLTKDDPFSPNYWARKVLWPKGETGHGHNGPVNTEVRMQRKEAGLKEKLVDLLAPARSSDPRIRAEGEFRAKNDMAHGGQFLGQFRGNYKERMQDHVDKATTQEKSAEASSGLLSVLLSRKENEKWAAAAKLADDNQLHNVAEIGGLGVLAAPYAGDVLKHRPGMIGGAAKAYDAAFGHSAPKAIQHKIELAGLGTLAAPSAYSLGKWGVNKVKGPPKQ